MITKDGKHHECEVCTSRVKNHRWGLTKAEGWFFTKKKDEAYCPEHVPGWVEEWRLKHRK